MPITLKERESKTGSLGEYCAQPRPGSGTFGLAGWIMGIFKVVSRDTFVPFVNNGEYYLSSLVPLPQFPSLCLATAGNSWQQLGNSWSSKGP